MSFGVETDPVDASKYDWARFRELSGLKKSDEVMEEYYLKLVALMKEVIEKGVMEIVDDPLVAEKPIHSQIEPLEGLDEGNLNPDDEALENGEPKALENGDDKTKFNPFLFKIERDGESMTFDKAKRLQKRLDILGKLRNDVLLHPELDERVASMRKGPKAGLPRSFTLN